MSITEDSGADRATDSRVSPWDEERYASLVANVPGAVYRCAMTSDWDMEYMSPEIENVSGYPAAEFLGLEPIRTFASVIHADDRDGVEEEVERAVERREPFALDYRIIHADGEIRWVHERTGASSARTARWPTWMARSSIRLSASASKSSSSTWRTTIR